jgi:hypothetical protein
VQIKESKWLVKCFLNYLRHEKRSKCSLWHTYHILIS